MSGLKLSLRVSFLVLLIIASLSVFEYVIYINGYINATSNSSYVKKEAKESGSPFISDDSLNRCLKHKNITLAFSQMMNDLNIEAVLIEPSVLFCLMSPTRRLQLKRKDFNISEYSQSKTITRFAIIQNLDALKEIDGRILKNHGFYYYAGDSSSSAKSSYVKTIYDLSHHFFVRSGEVIHAVIMRERGHYYWLEKIHTIPHFQPFAAEDFRFYKDDTAYEKFPVYSLIAEGGVNLAVPEDPGSFLHQLSSAKFLECDLSRSKHLAKNDTGYNMKLEVSFLKALEEMKFHLQPLLIDVFLLGGTLLGWYRQCGFIPYTTDIDFAAWVSDAGDLNFWMETFRNNTELPLVAKFGWPDEAFELRFNSKGVQVDLFFVYKDDNTTWVSGHVQYNGYYFKYAYPMFSLCSADLLGHKVLVPCEVLQMLLADYGPNWGRSVRNWYFASTSTSKNMGPPIYWPHDKKDKVYREF